MTWTPERLAAFRATMDEYVRGSVQAGMRYPVACMLVSRTGSILSGRYESDGQFVPLHEFNPPGATFEATAWMSALDSHGKSGMFTFYDIEPVEALKRRIFSEQPP